MRSFFRHGTRLTLATVFGVVLYYLIASHYNNESELVPETMVAELHGHRGPILACAFSPDATILATASTDGTVRIWDSSTFKLRTTLAGHTAEIQDIAFSPDGRHLLSASWDTSVRIWKTLNWQCLSVINRWPHESRAVSYSPDGSSFAVAGGKGLGSIQVYESTTGQLRWNGSGTKSSISRLVYLPGGRTVVTADEGWLTLWDEQTGQIQSRLPVGADGSCYICQIENGTNPSELVLQYQGGRFAKWSLATRRLVFEESSPIGCYTGFAFSPDRTVLARMWRGNDSFYGELQLVASVNNNVFAHVKCRNSYLHCICYSSDGKYIAIGGEMDTCVARVWDVKKIMLQGKTALEP